MVFVGFGVLIGHMPHVDVHQGGTGEKMIALSRNYRNPVVRLFADMPGSSNS
jgi:hypothetical protein